MGISINGFGGFHNHKKRRFAGWLYGTALVDRHEFAVNKAENLDWENEWALTEM
jgi:hypothetical protein